jgi:DNA (cytosine-5)-methyltransferase 1
LGWLGSSWRCAGAIDIDRHKAAAYRANFGDVGLIQDDIRNLTPDRIPDALDMVWASFPCKHVSGAGTRSGLDGAASGAWWPCWSLIQKLVGLGRVPGIVAIENVRGLIGSNDGAHFRSIIGALVAAGYRVGAIVTDARVVCSYSTGARWRNVSSASSP